MNAQVNIANVDRAGFAEWLEDATRGHRIPAMTCTIVDAIGTWEGRAEPGVVVMLWDTTPDAVEVMLGAYGCDHPTESAFGVLDLPPSRVHANPYALPVVA